MNITHRNSYVNKEKNVVFVYTVSGTPEELTAYRQIQGDKLREETVESVDDKGKPTTTLIPLFFSGSRVADGTKLAAKRDGTAYYAETELIENRVQRQLDRIEAVNVLLLSGKKLSPELLAILLP